MTKKLASPTTQAKRNMHMPEMGRALSMIASRPLSNAPEDVACIAADTSAPAEPTRVCHSKTVLTAL